MKIARSTLAPNTPMTQPNRPRPQNTSFDDAGPDTLPGSAWRFDHLSVSSGSEHALRRLFEGVMGFKSGPRPPFPFPGEWLYDQERAVVHAIHDASLSAEAGELRFNHIAFASMQPASRVIEQLHKTGLPFKVAQIPAEKVAQIFVQLPGHLIVELDVPDDTAGVASHVYSASSSVPTADEF